MAITAYPYVSLVVKAFNKEIDWDSDIIKVMLVTSTYVPNQDTHDYKNDISGEVSGTGYTAGGKVLTTKTITYNSTDNIIILDADDVIWEGISISNARYAVFYDDSPSTDTTKVLLWYVDFGEAKSVTNGTIKLTFNASGIVNIDIG